MTILDFTVEEINLVSIYRVSTRAKTVDRIAGMLPVMDSDTRVIAKSAIRKLVRMAEANFQIMSFNAADDTGG